MEKRKLLPATNGYAWLEAIDVDSDGNLFFTDSVRKILYRLDRTQPGQATIQPLLGGFEHLGGVSIDKAGNVIYLGARLKKSGKDGKKNIESKIIQIPLSVFGRNDPIRDYQSGGVPFDPQIKEFDLCPEEDGVRLPLPVPNGVVFDPKSKVVYYTHEALGSLGKGGYIGSTDSLKVRKFTSPNGIDLDTSAETTMVFSLVLKNEIGRLSVSSLYVDTGSFSFAGRWFPDGIFCMENGDLLSTSFLTGRVYHLPKVGRGYGAPRMIANGLDQPTDLVIGPSLNGNGKSLFVTTTKFLKVYLGGGGNIFEIPNIDVLTNS